MKSHNDIAKILILITQIGLTMLTSVFMCGAIGYFIDNKFNTNFLIFFILLGIAGGYSGVYKLVKEHININKNIENKDDEIDQNKEDK